MSKIEELVDNFHKEVYLLAVKYGDVACYLNEDCAKMDAARAALLAEYKRLEER